MKRVLSYSILVASLIVVLPSPLKAENCEDLWNALPLDTVASTVQTIEKITGAISKTYRSTSSGKVITIIFDPNIKSDKSKTQFERLKNYTALDYSESPLEYSRHPHNRLQYANLRTELKRLAEKTALVVLNPYEFAYYVDAKKWRQYRIFDTVVRLHEESEIPKISEEVTAALLLNQRKSIKDKTRIPKFIEKMDYTLFSVLFGITLLPVDGYVKASAMLSYVGFNFHYIIKFLMRKDRVIEEHQLRTSTNLIDSLLETSDHVVVVLPDVLQKNLTEAFSRNSDFY